MINTFKPVVGKSTTIQVPKTYISMNPIDVRAREEAQKINQTLSGQQSGSVVNTPYGGISTATPNLYQGAFEPVKTPAQIMQEAGFLLSTKPSQIKTSVAPGSPGIISAVSHTFIGDEINVTVTVRNTDSVVHEYRAYLYSADGDRMDKEPDTYYKNIQPGQNYTFRLSTNYGWGNISDLAGGYRVTVILEGGIFVDERFVSLSTGQVTNPDDRQPGTVTNPDTAPGIGGTPSFTQQPQQTGGIIDNISSFLGGATTGFSIGTLVILGGAIYVLTK